MTNFITKRYCLTGQRLQLKLLTKSFDAMEDWFKPELFPETSNTKESTPEKTVFRPYFVIYVKLRMIA